MKKIIQDKEEKEMIFETLHKVEELDTNCKTFICDEWILTSGTEMSEWFGCEPPQEMAEIDRQMNQQPQVDAYCKDCDAYICDERVTFEECCDTCGTPIEYHKLINGGNK